MTDKFGTSLRHKQTQLYDMCHSYLIDNFHKFTEANKLKVSLVLSGKMVPQTQTQKIKAEVTYHPTQKINFNDQPLEYNIGNRIAEHTEEVTTSSN